MKRRMLSAILALAMIFVMTVSVSAADVTCTEEYNQPVVDVDAEIERALNGETDLEIDASDLVSAWLVNADGTTETVDVLLTTRELPALTRDADSEEKLYATTAVVLLSTDKSTPKTGRVGNVKCTVTILWTDVLGIRNGFRGANIMWTVEENNGKITTLSNLHATVRGQTFQENGEYKTFSFTAPAGSAKRYTKTYSIPGSSYEDGWLVYRVWSYGTINSTQSLNINVATGDISIG